MRLSIIVPCHDAEPYLRDTIESVLAQSRPADEIVVVDDRSADRSLAIAREAAGLAPDRVRVIAGALGNAARTRNHGALAATGDALMFLDADDLLGPGALEALAGALHRHPGAVAACPWRRLEQQDGVWVERPPSCAPRRPGQDPLDAWLTGWYHPPCAVLWSRDAFDRAGRWDERTAVNQDGDLMMRALAHGVPLVAAAGGWSYYRRQPANRTSLSGFRFSREGLLSRARVIEKLAMLLAHRGSLRQHSRAIVAALDAIAADARRECPDLVAILRGQARRYRGGRVRAAFALREGGRAAPERVRVLLRHAGAAPAPRPPSWRPLVSVVVPSFNRARVLPRAAASVLGQTYGDLELLVVDDGSTDETGEVVSALGDARARCLRQPENTGAAAARNRGLREARGELIAFLDSDDEWAPGKLSAQVDVFRSSPPTVGLVYTGVETIDAAGASHVQRPGARGDVYREMLWRNVIHGGGSNVVVLREVVATAGFFHERLPAVEDYDYWLRVTRFFDVDFVDAPLARYHDTTDAARRSRALRANLEARWWMYRQYAGEMRDAGVAHLFLLHTARWATAHGGADARAVLRFLVQALVERPASRMAVATAAGALLPASRRLKWVRRHAIA